MEWLHLPETDSTNRVAKELARQGAAHGTAVLADRQTAGRGRLGRSFFSPEGGLYLSVILRPDLKPGDLGLITPMAAVAVCRALHDLCGVEAGIKWVNDLFLGGRKLCGILTEAAGGAVVVGMGLNWRQPEGGFPPELQPTVCALYQPEGGPVSREELARGMAERLLELARWLPGTHFLEEYRRRSLALGREVTVRPAVGQPYAARAIHIDQRARLVVRTDDGGVRALDSGEVSIRLTD